MDFQTMIKQLGQLKDRAESLGTTDTLANTINAGFEAMIENFIVVARNNGRLDELIDTLIGTDIDIRLYGDLAMGEYCRTSNIEKVFQLMDAGLQLKRMHWEYCHEGVLEIVRLLLERGVEPPREKINSCCYQGALEMVRIFLEFGIKFSQDNILSVIASNHIEIIKLLIAADQVDLSKALDYCQEIAHDRSEIEQLLRAERARRLSLVKSAAKK